MSKNVSSIIAACGKNRVKSILISDEKTEITFFPETPDQGLYSFHPAFEKMNIDSTPKEVPPELVKEVEAMEQEDLEDMMNLEDPASYETLMVKQALGEDYGEEQE